MGFLCVASPDPLFPASHKVPLSDLRILWVCIEAVEPFTIQSLVSSEIHTNFLASPYIQCVLSVILWTLLPLLSDRDLNFRLFFFFGFCPLRPDLVHDSSRTLDCEAYFTVFESLSVSSLYGILLHQIIYCHVLFPAGTCILVLSLSWECKLLKGRDHVLKFCIHHSASHSAWHKGAE